MVSPPDGAIRAYRERVRTLVALTLAVVLGLPAAAEAAPAPVLPGGEAPVAEPSARVLVISVDGLNPTALKRLGKARTPALHRLMREGAGTLNARSAVEMTVTLPNHTSMVTGRRIAAADGGHGVTWNDNLTKRTVQEAAGGPVSSVFTVIDDAGGQSAVFAGKSKFGLFARSWPAAVDRWTYDEDVVALTRKARADLVQRERELTFLHLSSPDLAGHRSGFMSPAYLRAVAATDRQVNKLLTAIDRHPDLAEGLTVVLTADHGGDRRGHGNPTRLGSYRIPFLTWGAGVEHGDLYALNPQRRDPGKRRPSYDAARQPVRNGDVANLVTSLLGLAAVPGSQLGAEQDLEVR